MIRPSPPRHSAKMTGKGREPTSVNIAWCYQGAPRVRDRCAAACTGGKTVRQLRISAGRRTSSRKKGTWIRKALAPEPFSFASHSAPAGSARPVARMSGLSLTLIAPLDGNGWIDLDLWQKHHDFCRVVRFRPDEPDISAIWCASPTELGHFDTISAEI